MMYNLVMEIVVREDIFSGLPKEVKRTVIDSGNKTAMEFLKAQRTSTRTVRYYVVEARG